jgi:hypothetical protein
MEAVFDYGDVYVDYISVFQNFVAWYTVANLMVNRGADRLGETTIVQRSGGGLLLVNDIVVAYPVQLFSGNALFYMWFYHFQHFSRQAASNAHLLYLFSCFYCDAHISFSWPEKIGKTNILGGSR